MAEQTAGDSVQDNDTKTESADVAAASKAEKTDERLFSQAEIDRIVKDRLARAKATPPPDYDDLKTKAAEFDKLQEASKSELEREREAREKAETEAAAIRATAEQRLVEAAVLAEATRQSAVKPEHLHKLIDTESVTVGDDGQVAGAEDAVKAFLDANPEYVGTRPAGSADQGARPGGKKQLTREQLQTMTNAEIVQAQKDGRLDGVLAGS